MNELSIVIPTLNEEVHLRKLLTSLVLQQDVRLDIIIADGGSHDNTCAVADDLGLSPTVVRGFAGKATQLNGGAAKARREFILFLHADSEFRDDFALSRAVTTLRRTSAENSGRMYAGHFAVRFTGRPDSSALAWKFLECKARLNRKGCSHGDQGILIPAGLFRETGGFDESCQILAETRFADRLRENGQWLLLPAELTTSPRRFEQEGLRERQTLNAVIMALGEAGWADLLDLTACYAAHDRSSKLQLSPVLRKIALAIAAMEESDRVKFWEKIGGYICENAWQPIFLAALWLQRKHLEVNEKDRYCLLEAYDRYGKRLIDNRTAARLAACASRIWLTYMSRG